MNKPQIINSIEDVKAVYEDLEYINNHGVWRDSIPEWASQLSVYYHVGAANWVILSEAYVQITDFLMARIDKLE